MFSDSGIDFSENNMKKINLYQDKNGVFHLYKTYKDPEYKLVEIEYDETAPCNICGLPVGDASTSGTDVCPSCDCGVFRNGEKWTVYPDRYHLEYFRKMAKEKANETISSRNETTS